MHCRLRIQKAAELSPGAPGRDRIPGPLQSADEDRKRDCSVLFPAGVRVPLGVLTGPDLRLCGVPGYVVCHDACGKVRDISLFQY